jgi:regulatory protein
MYDHVFPTINHANTLRILVRFGTSRARTLKLPGCFPSRFRTPYLRSTTVANPFDFLYSSLVFGKPRQLETESELYEAAQRALMRRPHSVSEMKKLLERRATSKLLAQVVLARLRESGMIDDSHYAKQFTRQRTEIRRQGKYRIARDLRARGVPDTHIEAAIAESADPDAERAAIRLRIDRKLKLTRGEVTDNKIASLYRSLLRAGFPSDAIRRELKAATAADLPDVDASSEA